ncbi:MAG: copper-containing nitrite reductase [Halodesulfurarchaeum sp.]
MFDTTRRKLMGALGVGTAVSLAGCAESTTRAATGDTAAQTTVEPEAATVAADPTDIPGPIDRDQAVHHDVTLSAEEVTAEIESGVTFKFMTFDGQIPGPLIRVREGDTISFTLENAPDSLMAHNVDFHAVYGTGGGSVATTAGPGKANGMEFTARYPGLFIYHCAVPNLDYHISSGMFGAILVEPAEGLPAVDREFYFGQHEVYTDKKTGEAGHHQFNFGDMTREDPTYVLLNGEKYAYAADNHGPLEAAVGETVRVFMVTGGPNLASNFHPIGNVWTEAYRDGAIASDPERYVQTMAVPPGSAMIGHLDLPVASRIHFVDHALSRVTRKGMKADLDVIGEDDPDVFDPSPDLASSQDEEGPMY